MAIDIIGLSGHAGCGKDYISEHFFQPKGYHNFSFAWHLKVGLIGKGMATHEEVFEIKPPHIRKLLQEEGTERGRMIYGENIWCDTAAEWIQLLSANWNINKFVIPDVRFPNEVEVIHKLGGRVFRIIAPTRTDNNGLTAEARKHISETALDEYKNFDGYIYNDPSISSTVFRQVNQLLNTSLDEDEPEEVLNGWFDRFIRKLPWPPDDV